MERRIAVNARTPGKWIGLLGLIVWLGAAASLHAADRVVLVANVQLPLNTLNSLEVQKLFLGLTVSASGTNLHALRNESDDFMRQIFYQDVVSMAEPLYERRLLELTLQQGRTAPLKFESTRALLDAIAADPYAVSYAWAADAAKNPRVKILRVLWQE